jgi:hypothetical protein
MDETFTNSDDIVEYLPENIASEKTLTKYCKSSYEGYVGITEKQFDLAIKMADLSTGLARAPDDKDAVEVAKFGIKAGVNATKGLFNIGSQMWSAFGALSYRADYYKFKKTYSEEKMDSLYKVVNTISYIYAWSAIHVLNLMDSYGNGNSIRSTAFIPTDVLKLYPYQELCDEVEEVHLCSNKIVRIILLNNMKRLRCEEGVKLQNDALLAFWCDRNKDNVLVVTEIYYDLIKAVKTTKSRYLDFVEMYKSNKGNYSIATNNNFEAIINAINKQVEIEIERTNVYAHKDEIESYINKMHRNPKNNDYFKR